jgi:hypothetical protein
VTNDGPSTASAAAAVGFSSDDLRQLSRVYLEDLFALKLLDEVDVPLTVGLEIAESSARDWLVTELSQGGGLIGPSPINRALLGRARDCCAFVRRTPRSNRVA